MNFMENTLVGLLLSSGKVTEETLKTIMREEGLYPYKVCQRLIDMGFVAEVIKYRQNVLLLFITKKLY